MPPDVSDIEPIDTSSIAIAGHDGRLMIMWAATGGTRLSILLPDRLQDIEVGPDGNLYALGTNTLSVFSQATLELIYAVPVPCSPSRLLLSADSRILFITNQCGFLTRLDTETRKVRDSISLPSGSIGQAGIDPEGNVLVPQTELSSGFLSIVGPSSDGTVDVVGMMHMSFAASAFASSARNEVYVSGSTFAVIDASVPTSVSTHPLAPIYVGRISSDERFLYAAGASSILRIDLERRIVDEVLEVGARPKVIAGSTFAEGETSASGDGCNLLSERNTEPDINGVTILGAALLLVLAWKRRTGLGLVLLALFQATGAQGLSPLYLVHRRRGGLHSARPDSTRNTRK